MRNHALLSHASLIASALFSLTAVPALAQDTAATSAETADDADAIVVTARRREENLIDVPIAITAISGTQLANQGAADITALAETVPNVTLESSRATNSTLSAFIRGVGQQDPVSGFEQGVGIYLDDVYLNRPQAAVLDIYDVQRIEVLRGPQGTLYGRNTIGGAVKYVTRRLDDKAHLSVRATYGSYNQADGVITASTPVGADGVIRIGGSLARLTRDGFGTNLTTGLDNYDKNIWAGRGTIEIHGTGIFARLTGDYTHDTSSPRGGHRVIPGLVSGAPVLANVYDTRGGLNFPKQNVTAWGTSLFLEAEPAEGLTFRSISSYRKDDSATPIDFDALPAVDVDVPGYYFNRQLSQELQVLVDKGPFNGLFGVYYLNATAITQFDVRLFTTINGLTGYTDANVDTETMAAFADFTYDFSNRVSLSVGGRYTWDERSAKILRQNYLGGGSPTFGGAGIPFGAPGTNFRGKQTFTKFTPRASLSFKPDQDSTFYVSFSQGFKGGGFDPRGAGSNAPDLNGDGIKSDAEIAQFLSFRPEKVNSYEVGYKAVMFDRRFTVALAAFRMDYTDVQIPGSVACTIGGLPSFCGVVSNAGKARMQGFAGFGLLVDILHDPLHRARVLPRPGAEQAALAHHPADAGIRQAVLPGIADPHDCAVRRAQAARALDLQEEQLDRIGHPGNLQPAPRKRAIVDRGAVKIGDEFAIGTITPERQSAFVGQRCIAFAGADQIAGERVDRHVKARLAGAHTRNLGLVIARDEGLAVAHPGGFKPCFEKARGLRGGPAGRCIAGRFPVGTLRQPRLIGAGQQPRTAAAKRRQRAACVAAAQIQAGHARPQAQPGLQRSCNRRRRRHGSGFRKIARRDQAHTSAERRDQPQRGKLTQTPVHGG